MEKVTLKNIGALLQSIQDYTEDLQEAVDTQYSNLEQILDHLESVTRSFAPCRLPEHVMKNSDLTQTDKDTFYAIAHFSAGYSGCSIPQKALAMFIGCSAPKISNSIRRLKDLGLLKVEKVNPQLPHELCDFPVFPDSELDFEDLNDLHGDWAAGEL